MSSNASPSESMALPPTTGDEVLDFRFILVTLKKYWYALVLSILLSIGMISSLIYFWYTPHYTAKTTLIKLDKNLNLSKDLYQEQRIDTLRYALKVPEILKQVKANLHLSLSLSEIAQSIDVVTPTRTNIMEITVSHPNQDLVAPLANELAQVFIHSPQNNRGVVNADSAILKEQRDLAQSKLAASKKQVQAFQESHQVQFFDHSTELLLDNFYSLKQELETDQLTVLKNRAQMSAIGQRLQHTPAQIPLSEEHGFQKLQDYRALQRKWQTLKQIYTERSPQMRSLRSEMDALEKDLDPPQGTLLTRQFGHNPVIEALQVEQAQLETETQATQSKIKALKQKVAQMDQFLKQRSNFGLQYQQLIQEKQLRESILNDLELKLVQSQVASKLRSNRIFDILQSANAPQKPRLSKKLLLILSSCGGGILGLIVCLLWLVIREATDYRIKSPRDYLSLQLPLLESLPERLSSQPPAAQIDFARQLRRLTVHLQQRVLSRHHRAQKSGPSQLLLFCSQERGEGKTFVATELAVALRNKGLSPVIIDCHLVEPGAQGLPALEAPRLNEALNGDWQKAKTLTLPPSPQHHYQWVFNSAAELLSLNPQNLAALKQKLASEFDLILLLLPALESHLDLSLELAPLAEGVLLISQFRRIPRHRLQQSLKALQAAANSAESIEHTPSIWGVLNRVEIAYQNL